VCVCVCVLGKPLFYVSNLYSSEKKNGHELDKPILLLRGGGTRTCSCSMRTKTCKERGFCLRVEHEQMIHLFVFNDTTNSHFALNRYIHESAHPPIPYTHPLIYQCCCLQRKLLFTEEIRKLLLTSENMLT
jgi:hypothetical protein